MTDRPELSRSITGTVPLADAQARVDALTDETGTPIRIVVTPHADPQSSHVPTDHPEE